MNASEISRALASHAEAVCRHYLPNGRKQGRYWICGSVRGEPGQSMHVRLAPPGQPGKWTDQATDEHGDLLDIIRTTTNASELRDAIVEAHRFLSVPVRPQSPPAHRHGSPTPDTRDSARRIWRQCRPIDDSPASAYLQARGIPFCQYPSLRFHPGLYYRDGSALYRFPAMVAAAVDQAGKLTGIHRTWLHPRDPDKAPVSRPRKALGHLRRYAVRFNRPRPGGVLVAGEGIETVLSIVTAIPRLPVAATLSASHLAAFDPPPDLGLLIVATDNEPDGRTAAARLAKRCAATICPARIIEPVHGDFNDDLRELGPEALARSIEPFLGPDEARRRHHADTPPRVTA